MEYCPNDQKLLVLHKIDSVCQGRALNWKLGGYILSKLLFVVKMANPK